MHSLPFPLTTVPTNGEFGNNAPFRKGNRHRGVDFSELRGAVGDIIAVVGGTCVTNQYSSVLGHVAEIEDSFGDVWGYAHMAAASPLVVGKKYVVAPVVGVVGGSGQSTGDHLHLTCGRAKGAVFSGVVVDPVARIIQRQKDQNMKPNARQIASAPAKRREEPTTIGENYDPSENYAPGAWVEWDGFVRSTMEGGQPGGDRIWLVKDRLYTAWTTTVPVPGDGALAGIPDLGTYPTTPPVVTPPVTPPAGTEVTKAEVQAIVSASEKRILDAMTAATTSIIAAVKKLNPPD